jgi:hypothetical protein
MKIAPRFPIVYFVTSFQRTRQFKQMPSPAIEYVLQSGHNFIMIPLVPLDGLEPSILLGFEPSASTSSATGAHVIAHP